MSKAKAYASFRDLPLPLDVPRREPGDDDVRHRHRLLRRLPLRPPPGAQRVGRAPLTPWCPATRSSGRVAQVGRGGHRLQGGRPGRRGLHGGLLPHLRELQARAWSSTARRAPPSPTTAPRWTGKTAHLRRLLRRTSSWTSFVLKIAARPGPGARGAAAVRRHHHLLAAARTGTRARATSVGVVGLGGLGHMAVKLAAAMGAEVTVLSTSAARRPTPGAWARTSSS